MIWLYIYLGIGGFLLLVFVILEWVTNIENEGMGLREWVWCAFSCLIAWLPIIVYRVIKMYWPKKSKA